MDEAVKRLIELLLMDMPQYRDEAARVPDDALSQRRLLRSLMNLRLPAPLSQEYLRLQDALLSEEREQKGVVDAATLPAVDSIALWQGDITRLKADAIVNAANSELLGCFWPCHGCIDNAIHSAAGLQLRQACHELMEQQGHAETTGTAKLTPAYNLPSRFVLHTVGPIVGEALTVQDEEQLADCYRSCLKLAVENGCQSVAFCCISTGEFHFPNQRAAEIAVAEVRAFLQEHSLLVIFNVFKDEDRRIYEALLAKP